MDLCERGVFDWLNDKCAVLIDEYEDERIPYEKLRTVKAKLAASNNPNIVKLNALVCEAINRQTGLYFYF